MQRDGSTALIQACLCNHPGIVKILLENKPNVNLADKVHKYVGSDCGVWYVVLIYMYLFRMAQQHLLPQFQRMLMRWFKC